MKIFQSFFKIKKTIFLMCGLVLFSCHKTTSNRKHTFKILIDLISYQDISIQVFYKLKADDSYSEKFSFRDKLSGKTNLQLITFELPNGIKPKNIRIDFDGNTNDSIRIENISFQYKNNILSGKGGIYKTWFDFNENVVLGRDSLTYYLKRKNNFFAPQINGNRILNSKLVKLFPPDINEF